MHSDFERRQILDFNDIRWSLQKMADKIKRSKTDIFKFPHNPITCGIFKPIKKLGMLLKQKERLSIRTVAAMTVKVTEVIF